MLRLPDWGDTFRYDVPVLPEQSVRVSFGPGTIASVGSESRLLGGRSLLIAGAHEADVADEVAAHLGSDLVGRLREVTQHVPVEVADDAVATTRAVGAETLVCIGGGSATGLAKAIALSTGLPIVAVPTTYAGSEMTAIWGLTGPDGKTTGRDVAVLPRTVVYDPEVTFSLPPWITAASGMNAAAHALESLYAPDTTEQLSGVAELALGALSTSLPVAVARPVDLRARSQALYGAWLAGWSLGSTTMGLHHKLAHMLGGTYRLPHGSVHSALLPQVAAFNSSVAPRAFIRAARAMGVRGPHLVAAALFDLAAGMGAPTSLEELGLESDALDEVVAIVLAGQVTNPRELTRPELSRVLQNAYVGAHP